MTANEIADMGLKYSVENGQGKILYRGPSMNPTLKDGDLLYVRAYADREIKCGDVVVFFASQRGDMIAHRVAAVDSRGIRTRGITIPARISSSLTLRIFRAESNTHAAVHKNFRSGARITVD